MLQCIAKTEGGKRTVAGVHWDYDCYGERDSLSCHGLMLQIVVALSQCACSGKTVRSHLAEVSKEGITMRIHIVMPLCCRRHPEAAAGGADHDAQLGP